MITCLESDIILFFKLSANRYALRLSNDLLFITKAQGADKLCRVKVEGPKKLSDTSAFYLVRKGSIWSEQEFFQTFNFGRSQF